jgi:phenylalanine-4-hydroxylase
MDTILEQSYFLKTLQEKSGHGALRGDYSLADAQYVVVQDCSGYTPEQHALWRKLYQRQSSLMPGRACDMFIDSLAQMQAADAIPNLDRISEGLFKATGWHLVAVPGLVPDQVFFEHLANRRFPVTVWLREAHEFDYIVEPDLFHDFFGHVPLLFNPIFAEHVCEYGKSGLRALALGGLSFLSRLYWYTVEFGLIRSAQGLRAYGAGILSSGGEVTYALTSPKPRRIPFDLERVMRTRYKIDAYQETYFIIQDFQQLFDAGSRDFTEMYPRLATMGSLPATAFLSGEINEVPL